MAYVKKDINVEIGARVKDIRKLRRYTREALAELVDISPQFLANIECGKKGMSFGTLTKLCNVLGVTCDYIITGKDVPSDRERLRSMLDHIDDDFLPSVETILGAVLETIAVAQKDDGRN